MLRDIRNLALQYVREHWLRDILILLMFTAAVVTWYMSRIALSNILYAVNLRGVVEGSRGESGCFWILFTVIYSLVTLFGGYGDSRRSYAAMLLPAGTGAKFAWEILRTLVLFPLAALCLWWAFDELFIGYITGLFNRTEGSVIASFRSIARSLTATVEPLNYIPCILYALVWFHSVALVVRSGISRLSVAAVVAAAAILVACIDSYPFVGMDYEARYGAYNYFHPAVVWRSHVSWCSVMTGRVLSYMWYAAMPAVFYALAYFKFKERRMQ